MIYRLSLLSLLLTCLPCWLLAAPQVLNRIVAYADKAVITQLELTQQVNLIKHQLQQSHTPLPSDAVLQKQVLNHLIDMSLQLQRAHDLALAVTPGEVQQALIRIAEKNHMSLVKMQHFFAKQGIDFNVYRRTIEQQLLVSKLQQTVVGPTVRINKLEVDAALRQIKRKPGQWLYHVRDILVPVSDEPTVQEWQQAAKRAQALLAKLQGGADFSRIAVADSSGHNALQGGDLGWRKLAALPEAFAKVIKTLSVGQVSKPIRAANGYHLIKLVATKNTQSQQPVDRAQVERLLYQRELNAAIETWLNRLRASSYVKIVL